jgi:hypothetical protein
MKMRARLLVMVAGCCLLVPAWIGSFSSGAPTLYSPLPTLTISPAFLLSHWRLEHLAVLGPALLFFLWIPGLVLNLQSNLPLRTIALLGLLTVLTVLYFAVGWSYGVEYQGVRYTVGVCAIYFMWLVCLWWAVIHWRRKPSFRGNLLCHWLLFAWLAWYAFPYLGELP